MENFLSKYLSTHKDIVNLLESKKIAELLKIVKATRDTDNQIFIIGNGGSATCAAHLQVDLGKGASTNKSKKFKVFCPSNEIPWLTAIGNDNGYDKIFSQQIENFCKKDDLLIAISVSGNSPNLVEAFKKAKQSGLKTAAIVGDHNGQLIKLSDLCLIIPSKHYGHVEDIQTLICHAIAYYFMEIEK
ncbi:MAG: hypothetical protein A2252_03025 [Elusimicrobia bacterium RIFOXYA2_FULL_39_19]|nr:MAG: hypothetical protein A2252_03025 [Elusimicrobia bacterium RIFOXYA2_FULL_39_19]